MMAVYFFGSILKSITFHACWVDRQVPDITGHNLIDFLDNQKRKKSQGKMRDKMNYRPLTGWSLSFTRTYNLSVHERKPMYLFLSFSCAFKSAGLLNVSSIKKKSNNKGGQELKTKMFVSLDFRNHLDFVSNFVSQLEPPLHGLAFLG